MEAFTTTTASPVCPGNCAKIVTAKIRSEGHAFISFTLLSRWDRPNEEVAAALEARILQANNQVDEAVQVTESTHFSPPFVLQYLFVCLH